MATNLTINSERLWDTLMDTAQYGATPKGGVRRLTLSDEDRMVRDWFTKACEAAGLTLAIDTMGNMFATRPGTDPNAPPIAVGSHLDTQPAGGKFDGILGVLAGLEAIRTLNDAGYQTTHPITLINWTNEEGARYAPGMSGSGVYSGELTYEQMMSSADKDGAVFGEELERIGYKGTEPVGERKFAAFVELHIEQGPILEAEEIQIGVVEGGQGLYWFDGTVAGRDSHAGTTPMTHRRDAMMALAELALAIEEIALANAPAAVGTMGEVAVLPGSRNTIPGTATFRAELRHPDGATLTAMAEALDAKIAEIAARRPVDITLDMRWRKDPVTFDPRVVEAVAAAVEKHGLTSKRMISGAGHDAFYVASLCPTGMIFIPCWEGISHNEEESATQVDCAAGAQVVLDTLVRLDETL
ncbi:Zn-dependent hydrolase [Acuticoccus sp. I52.16.1]|uniref:Zn-dependent hydrolase n=1 Tax=Acuticoccus sp. I52.16.1 TaxID=2928472 RepID=UPI001FD25792|nr:Zn-dependent hydrolase [Acuticoccus sp. I52.16.1]UOM35289.1 Zn-dependent hydrolase [Acuticoccus sp. I52.16.1]